MAHLIKRDLLYIEISIEDKVPFIDKHKGNEKGRCDAKRQQEGLSIHLLLGFERIYRLHASVSSPAEICGASSASGAALSDFRK